MDILPLFVDHYIRTLLWSTSGDNSEDLSAYELSESAKMEIAEECQQFIFDNIENIKKAEAVYGLQMVAHDFCLTRNGHGAGFWDGDLPSELGEALTKATKAFEQQDAYVGDDGLVYV